MKIYRLKQNVGLNNKVTFQLKPLPSNDIISLCWDKIPINAPNLAFEVEKRVPITDVLSQATINTCGLMVSQKIKNIFNRYNLINHKYYEAKIDTGSLANSKYYWLHILPQEIHENIDYSKSKFYISSYGFREDDMKITSYSDFLNKKKEIGISEAIKSEQLIFKKDFVGDFDLFLIGHFNYDIFISERLKEALIKNRITGIEIEESRCFKNV